MDKITGGFHLKQTSVQPSNIQSIPSYFVVVVPRPDGRADWNSRIGAPSVAKDQATEVDAGWQVVARSKTKNKSRMDFKAPKLSGKVQDASSTLEKSVHNINNSEDKDMRNNLSAHSRQFGEGHSSTKEKNGPDLEVIAKTENVHTNSAACILAAKNDLMQTSAPESVELNNANISLTHHSTDCKSEENSKLVLDQRRSQDEQYAKSNTFTSQQVSFQTHSDSTASDRQLPQAVHNKDVKAVQAPLKDANSVGLQGANVKYMVQPSQVQETD